MMAEDHDVTDTTSERIVDVSDGRAVASHSLDDEAEAKYRALVNQLPAIVYTAEFGEMGDWLYVSPQIEEILGFSAEEWLHHPHPMHTLVHPDDLPRIIELENVTRQQGQPYEVEYRITAKDGRTMLLREEAVLVTDGGGQPLFWQGVMFDLTELEESNVRRDQLEYVMSHDLLYSIANLRNLSVALSSKWDELAEDSRRRIASWIAEETARLRDLADETIGGPDPTDPSG